MLIGLVKWYDREKEFGLITTVEGGDYLFQLRNFEERPSKILKGTPIVFYPIIDNLKKKHRAKDCQLVNMPNFFKLIFEHLEKSDVIEIGSDRPNQGYTSFSLIGLSLKYFLKGKTESELLTIITDYFNNYLNKKHFISFCEHLEKGIINNLDSVTANSLLNQIFSYFAKNIDDETLFLLWRQDKFRYINTFQANSDSFEIDENIIKANRNKIAYDDLNKILSYTYGVGFCSEHASNLFGEIGSKSSNDILDLFKYLKFFKDEEIEKRKNQLKTALFEAYFKEVEDRLDELRGIGTTEEFEQYNVLIDQTPNLLEQEHKEKIAHLVTNKILINCKHEFRIELWLLGILSEVNYNEIQVKFTKEGTTDAIRLRILTKVDEDVQFQLFKQFTRDYSPETTFQLLEKHLRETNNNYFQIKDVLFDSTFWNNRVGQQLVERFNDYIENELDNKSKFNLFLKGYYDKVPKDWVFVEMSSLDESNIEKICNSEIDDKNFLRELLISRASCAEPLDYRWIYNIALNYLSPDYFNSFDKSVFDKINEENYFSLWLQGVGKTFPFSYIEARLDENYGNYRQIKDWLNKGITSTEQIQEVLFKYIKTEQLVSDRIIFYKKYNHIKCLLDLDYSSLSFIRELNNPLYDLFLWVLSKIDPFNYDVLKSKFIYFEPIDQARIIKKLVSLKALGQFELSIEKLNELTRFDADLYNSSLNFNPHIPIDISSDVVIKALLSFKENGRFIPETELIKIVTSNLNLVKTDNFQLGNYFEKCLGRSKPTYQYFREGNRNAEIKKVKSLSGNEVFAITIPTGKIKSEYNPRRKAYVDVFEKNLNFDTIKNAVKGISGARWESNSKQWIVPIQEYNAIMQLAHDYLIYLDFEGDSYANNSHLVKYFRDDIPDGITFCEGRQSNRLDEKLKKEFWWCEGRPCFEKCEFIHDENNWEKYTLLDFCEIFGLNTDERTSLGDFIPKGHYYLFIALINRFNKLLNRLFCDDCGHVLKPLEHSNFAAHSVVRFVCSSDICTNKRVVYLNHCLNGKCGGIIDSRVAHQCSNGLVICDSCGSCCSHAMFQRKLEDLRKNGGVIPKNLQLQVDEKLGHLEQSIYFCYKCKEQMVETQLDIFKCPNENESCNVVYDTTKFKLQRPFKHLKRRN